MKGKRDETNSRGVKEGRKGGEREGRLEDEQLRLTLWAMLCGRWVRPLGPLTTAITTNLLK